ncbi:hypothetical protein [Paraburkholderia acidipaludis]|uniref:hypothetical protein n=1 Tax=Paraburkholderia acidipaludis TaxID=660537 RepID=UPI0004896379|nr:hypothetical protein [Paraburkholderia acidipaludis]
MKRTLATASVVALAASAPAFAEDIGTAETWRTAHVAQDNESIKRVTVKAVQSSELDYWNTTTAVWTPFRH